MDLGPIAATGISFDAFAARLSAVTCPTGHADAVPVDEYLTKLIVAWLCPTCDQQLPADWKPAPPSYSDLFFDPNLIMKEKR